MSKDKKEEAAPSAKEAKDTNRAARIAAIKAFQEKVHKKLGSDEILIMGNERKSHKVDVISTGSISLDVALGVGGLPRGRIVEIYGPEASGKTTTTLSIIAQAQKAGLFCGFVDAEQALDVSYAKKLGVKFDESLLLCQPNSGEQGLQMATEMCESGNFDVVIVDSVAALTPQKEIDGEVGDQFMGLQARMMGQALRKLVAPVKNNNVLLIFINQLRMKIGVMFGSPETTPGGEGLKFYASVRMRVSKMKGKEDSLQVKLANDDGTFRTVDGYKMRVSINKNKLAVLAENVEVPILDNMGIYLPIDLFSAAKTLEVIENKAGRTHTFGDRVISTKSEGEAFAEFVKDKKLMADVEKAVRAKVLAG